MRRPLRAVLVSGPSMAPTLRHGDAVLVWCGWSARGPRVRAGDVVLARFPSLPDRLVVKRAVRPEGPGWWLLGDNPLASDDSRTHGAGVVEARVVWRYWPPSRRAAARAVPE